MKKNFTFKASLFVFAGVLSLTVNAQQKPAVAKNFGRVLQSAKTEPCATVRYESLLQKRNPAGKSKEQFEQWIAPKVLAAKKARIQKNGNTIVNIPVVFHIIHNGNPTGVAENIDNERIVSQIDVLNEDFRRLEGSNGYNVSDIGADMEINFCLAQQDPDGIVSTGIVRYAMGDGQGWTMEQAEMMKPYTQWDPEKYLNIWVVDDIPGAAGYSQFPTESGLEGLEDDDELVTAQTDGVVLGYRYVGSEQKYPQGGIYSEERNLGRTASHEIGHFFGLRHIWGDGEDCTATDYCNDTPPMTGPNYGCQTGLDTCPSDDIPDMIENYMSYSDDFCVNIFTLNQKDRMQAVLENSPRRHSLITSPGCLPGITLANDAALQINIPNTECAQNTITPELVITNAGTSNLTSASVSYHVDNQAPLIYNWAGLLAAGASATIALPSIILTPGQHTFTAAIDTVNNTADVTHSNSVRSLPLKIMPLFTTNTLKVTIQTDDYGADTLWGIMKDNNEDNIIAGNINIESIYQSNFYNSNELYITDVPITQDGCYTFFMFDFSSNGICCDFGNGYYKVETDSGIVVAEGGSFMQYEDTLFSVYSVLATPDLSRAGLILYPNPANSVINIASAIENMPDNYTVYNSLGQVMDKGEITSSLYTLDIAKYAGGVYFVKIAKGSQTKTLQFIKY